MTTAGVNRFPQGGAVIDTPGMREIGVEGAELNRTFEIEKTANYSVDLRIAATKASLVVQ